MKHIPKSIFLPISILILFFSIWLNACKSTVVLPKEIELALKSIPQKIDFNMHVRPILSDKCYKCHGPDISKVQGELRLDSEESAYKALSGGEGNIANHAIVPNDLSGSEVYHRIISNDPEYVMPSPKSNLSLTTNEKAILIAWIQQGAEYKKHWAFVAPTLPAMPKVRNINWVKNEIDNFILTDLEKNKINVNANADKSRLIRRVSFDLTGLPPSQKEIDDYLNDKTSNAFEKVVDRLFQSNHFGERMAIDWLDIARYADTHGYQDDGFRNAWPYRNWVINAFNANLSYDKFITHQLAGDMFKNPTTDMLVATCFNRNHPQTQEGGVVDEEYRIEYVADRTSTFGKAFLGMTVECARCHDHKYDPISQKDYFQLFAYFNNNNDQGIVPYNGEAAPTVILPTEKDKPILKKYDEKIIAYLEAVNKENYRNDFEKWLNSLALQSRKLVNFRKGEIGYFTFDNYILSLDKKVVDNKDLPLANKMINIANLNAESKVKANVSMDLDRKPKVVKGKFNNAMKFIGEAGIDFSNEFEFEQNQSFTISIWVNLLKDKTKGTILGSSNGDFEGYRGFRVLLNEDRTLQYSMGYVLPSNGIEKVSTDKLPLSAWTHLVLKYDGKAKAEGFELYLNGKMVNHITKTDHLTKSIVYGEFKSHWSDMPFMLGKDDRGTIQDIVMDELRVYNRDISEIELKSLSISKDLVSNFFVKKSMLNPHQKNQFFEWYLSNGLNLSYQKNIDSLKFWRGKKVELLTDQPEVMVMAERTIQNQTYLLKRGAYDAPDYKVFANTPAKFGDFGSKYPKNRLGLAQWLIDEKNPLTSRVVVNRFWSMFFGKGLVVTSEDFGMQGDLPTNLPLLDYLSVDFMNNKWDVKRILKKIVMSATYQQSSIANESALKNDPDNKYFSRFPVYRLTGEMIRDNALASSSLLVPKIGGPSVYPYQPDSLWEALATRNKTHYSQGHGEDLYRRSLYTVWKRSTPPPSMMSFDATDRYSCVIRRQKTASPQQSLIMMNDPQFVEASRKIAERMMTEVIGSAQLKIEFGFKLLTSRKPSLNETDILNKLLLEQLAIFKKNPAKATNLLKIGESKTNPNLEKTTLASYMIVANTILNFDETYIKR